MVAANLELGLEPLPHPRAVPGAVNEAEDAHAPGGSAPAAAATSAAAAAATSTAATAAAVGATAAAAVMAAAVMSAAVMSTAAGLAAEERERPTVRAAPAADATCRLGLADPPRHDSHHDQYDDQHDHAAKVAT
jgi:hypothetical protein